MSIPEIFSSLFYSLLCFESAHHGIIANLRFVFLLFLTRFPLFLKVKFFNKCLLK